MKVIEQEREIREEIDPQLLSSLEHLYPSVRYPFFELLDNDLDSANPNNPTLVNINVSPEKISYTSLGGEGMNFEELKNFFVWGRSSKNRKLGRYGHGAKTAMVYLANNFKLGSAKAQGEYWEVSGENIREHQSGLKKFRAIRKGQNRGNAIVKIELTKLEKKIDPKSLRLDIANYYRLALEKKKIVVYVNDQLVEPTPIPLAEVPKPFEFPLPKGGKVTGWIATLDESKNLAPQIRRGIRGNVYDRLFTQGLMFGYPTAEANPSLRVIIGEMNIESDEIPVTSAKNDFDESAPIWQKEVQPNMQKILEPYVSRLLASSELERTPRGDRLAIHAAVKAVKFGLARLGESLPTILGRGIRLRILETAKELSERENYPNKTKRHKITHIEKTGKESSERKSSTTGFPEIDLRDLGPNIRSDYVTEKEETIIILNPNFPAYKTNRDSGVLPLYLIEVVAYELARIANFEHRGEVDYDRFLKYTYESLHSAAIQAAKREKLL